MSAAVTCNCACPNPTVTLTPGSPGENGAAGADGANGINAFTVLTAAVVIPAVDAIVLAAVAVSSWAGIGQILFLSDGTDKGHFQVVSVPSAQSLQLKFLGYPNDSPLGSSIGIGVTVSPSGV